MPNTDIHQQELSNPDLGIAETPKSPAFNNKDTAPQDATHGLADSIKTTPKGVLNTTPELSTKAYIANPPQHHRGTVTDPAHDRRLHKQKKDQEHQQQNQERDSRDLKRTKYDDIRDLIVKRYLNNRSKLATANKKLDLDGIWE